MTSLSTRIRVDAYTNLHAVAELDDGHLYGAQRFVKAAGGCSAPAAKQDAELDPARARCGSDCSRPRPVLLRTDVKRSS